MEEIDVRVVRWWLPKKMVYFVSSNTSNYGGLSSSINYGILLFIFYDVFGINSSIKVNQ